jgi:hypothetical protein
MFEDVVFFLLENYLETYTNGFCGWFRRFFYGRYLKTVEACLLFATNKYVNKVWDLVCLLDKEWALGGLGGLSDFVGKAPDREKGIGNSISQSIGLNR